MPEIQQHGSLITDGSLITNGIVLPQEYREHYQRHSLIIRSRIAEFAAVERENYIWELAFCLLTPQSRAAHAEQVIARLQHDRFMEQPFDPTFILRDPAHYIRFHNEKAKRLLALAEQGNQILSRIDAASASASRAIGNRPDSASAARSFSMDLREWLVPNVKGLGWKEGSHFLRNIGHSELAIIDRHILKHMLRLGAIEAIPGSIGTRRAYLQLEERFRKLAVDVGLPLQELDLLIWSLEEGSVRK